MHLCPEKGKGKRRRERDCSLVRKRDRKTDLVVKREKQTRRELTAGGKRRRASEGPVPNHEIIDLITKSSQVLFCRSLRASVSLRVWFIKTLASGTPPLPLSYSPWQALYLAILVLLYIGLTTLPLIHLPKLANIVTPRVIPALTLRLSSRASAASHCRPLPLPAASLACCQLAW